VERELSAGPNVVIVFFATDFSLKSDDNSGYVLTFTCPCYLGAGMLGSSYDSVGEVMDQEVVTVKLLTEAVYNVYVSYLNSGEGVSYRFPLKTNRK